MVNGKEQKQKKSKLTEIIIVTLTVVLILGIALWWYGKDSEDTTNTAVELDTAMITNGYNTDITLLPSAGVKVTEQIDVSFTKERHGIYRYFRNSGVLSYEADGKIEKHPYKGSVSMEACNVAYESSSEGDFSVYKLGDEDTLISSQNYEMTYTIEPTFNTKDIEVAYINVFPSRWQNEIPAGSTFTIHFPDGYQKEDLQFYSGEYGSTKDGSSLLDLTYGKNEVTGTLKENLPLGSGITAFEHMSAGYFTEIDTGEGTRAFSRNSMIFAVILSVILFVLFGWNRKPITSIQYAPPKGHDSATMGYVLDEKVDGKDLLSLILYWADQGNIRIQSNGEIDLKLKKVKQLPADAPKHQVTLFQGIFPEAKEKSNEVDLEKLERRFTKSAVKSAHQIYELFSAKNKNAMYSKVSKFARWVAVTFIALAVAFCYMTVLLAVGSGILVVVLTVLTMIGTYSGMSMMLSTRKKWHSTGTKERKKELLLDCLVILGSFAVLFVINKIEVLRGVGLDDTGAIPVVAIGTVVGTFLAGGIRRRTKKAMELMGWFLGIRDFIETAELDRINAMAEEHPDWFYHLLPYAYVMGLTDTWVKRLDAIGVTIDNPDWGDFDGGIDQTWFYTDFSNRFDPVINKISDEISQAVTAESASFDSDSGSFSSSSSGDGGFSGGGFGGGGGGSW